MNACSWLELSLLMWGRWWQLLREAAGQGTGWEGCSLGPPPPVPHKHSHYFVPKSGSHTRLSRPKASKDWGSTVPKGYANHAHTFPAALAPAALLFPSSPPRARPTREPHSRRISPESPSTPQKRCQAPAVGLWWDISLQRPSRDVPTCSTWQLPIKTAQQGMSTTSSRNTGFPCYEINVACKARLLGVFLDKNPH